MANSLNILSLAAGTCMLDIAIERVFGVPCRIVAVEIESYACGNLVAKTEEGRLDIAALWPNVKTFPYRAFHNCFDVLTAGFPCQPFSVAGKGNGVYDPRHLWPYIADGISEVEPTLVVLENVPGIISTKCADGTPVLLYVLRDLEQRGYKVTWGIYSAAEVGAPQKRERVFIVAYAPQLGIQGLWSEGQQITETHAGQALSLCGCGRWPAGRGQEQYEWEEPRTIKSGVGRVPDEFSAWMDANNYQSFREGKLNAEGKRKSREVLLGVWQTIGTEANQWETGRLYGFLEAEILRFGLQSSTLPHRITDACCFKKTGGRFPRAGVSGMWEQEKPEHSPYRPEPIEQFKRELAYAMRQLSYEIALATREDFAKEGIGYMLDLWNRMPDAWWDVPETLPEIQEVWQSLDYEEKRGCFVCAVSGVFGRIISDTDRLRLTGNGIVPDTAEKAIRELMSELLTNS